MIFDGFCGDLDGFCCTNCFFVLKVVSRYLFSELKWKLSMIPGAPDCRTRKEHSLTL